MSCKKFSRRCHKSSEEINQSKLSYELSANSRRSYLTNCMRDHVFKFSKTSRRLISCIESFDRILNCLSKIFFSIWMLLEIVLSFFIIEIIEKYMIFLVDNWFSTDILIDQKSSSDFVLDCSIERMIDFKWWRWIWSECHVSEYAQAWRNIRNISSFMLLWVIFLIKTMTENE
jgi:hypothetical protein